MIDYHFFYGDPENVRERLTHYPDASTINGTWHVYETISADGTLAVGIAEGKPDRGIVMIVYENLSRPVGIGHSMVFSTLAEKFHCWMSRLRSFQPGPGCKMDRYHAGFLRFLVTVGTTRLVRPPE